MILVLGKGYIGQAFCKELEKREIEYIALSRKVRDYTQPEELRTVLEIGQFELVINCSAFIPKESVSLCDKFAMETIQSNLLFPKMLAELCDDEATPLAHISTACMWNDGKEHSECDPPQRAFNGYCGFYVGIKFQSEIEILKFPSTYVWRIRLPFDEFVSDRNYLSKLAQFPQVWDQTNSCSHRGDFVKACLDLWKVRGEFGTYNVVNPGSLNSGEVVVQMKRRGLISTLPEIVQGKTEGQCLVSCKKIQDSGVKIRNVQDALQESLDNWIDR